MHPAGFIAAADRAAQHRSIGRVAYIFPCNVSGVIFAHLQARFLTSVLPSGWLSLAV